MFVPIMTTPAGLCLTAANWKEVGVRQVSCYLADLLIKPGYAVLTELTNLRDYLGWDGQVVLNMTVPKVDKAGLIVLVSPYDGSRIKLTLEAFFHVARQLNPDAVILPQQTTAHEMAIVATWPESIAVFSAGVALPFVESDEPAAKAYAGKVYTSSGEIDVLDSDCAMQFEVIEPHCGCPTCQQKLTRAYLHHLLMQTPLLCQRFLIQHNVYARVFWKSE